MIKAVVICNTSGKPRLIKFYDETSESQKQEFLRETYSLLHRRTNSSCNFLEAPTVHNSQRIIYRQYSTIYIVFCVDLSESELGILDLIQVFVDLLDKTFENVCELDLIFNADKVHYLLNELICGGIVLETNHTEILSRLNEQQHLGGGSTDSTNSSTPKTSFLSNRILSGVRAGSNIITSVVPSTSARGWASALASSATSLRISNRLGFQNISEGSEEQNVQGSKESKKLCL
ncbi:AP-3 complex subunit sigma-1 [Echinococcus granulosus]|uniref:AP-3 complex subunit sigma-1 n=1 Tax=Echinococcus granulosus TaxID=6210 RepID=W6UDX1_ECHGR|nr:AP-3 complex subunit sigma-1 [Echinococcus granulosus]EUB59585.1 AP-3 complex subunit sigma-1 [Echinococcus granulosus]KAH9277762.1 AP-3 complex subunit sigma-1 [Echinococcus granulosus]